MAKTRSIDPNKIPKEVRTTIDPKIAKQIPNPICRTAMLQQIARTNELLATHGFDPPVEGFSVDEYRTGYTSAGRFYLGQEYLESQFTNPDTLGIWIWLIKEISETKLIVSRAGTVLNKENIPDLGHPYQIHRSRSDGLLENYIESRDMSWKRKKIAEGLFNITKGFFIGKNLILGHFRLGFNRIQVEVLQDASVFPMLCFYHIQSDNSLRHIGISYAERNPYPVDRVFADGAGCSRPCPPYGEE